MRITLGERLDNKLSVGGPTHGGNIEVFLGLIEADIAIVHAIVLTFIEALGVDLYIFLGYGTLAKLHPRTRTENTLAINRHPSL